MKNTQFQFSKKGLLLIIIILSALILRVWALDRYPVGLNADEAAIGYNAYSIIQTGRDEYGSFFPLSFKSFGDYKPGLYFYFVIPFVALLGLNEWAVRLPSALIGVGTVVLIFFLAKKIFNSEKVGVASSFLLAISPWHLHFSRGGWETNVATFFMTLGVFLFIRKTGSPMNIFFSMLSFLASMYLYQSPRLVVPLLTLFLVILNYKKIIPHFRKLMIYAVILSIMTVPLAMQFIGGGGSERFSGLSFLSDKGPENRINELRGDHGGNTLSAKLFHNKAVAYGMNFVGHYLDHFNPNFYFINGDPIIRNKVPEQGQFYLIYSLFLVLGLFGIISLHKKGYEHLKLLVIWILIAPIASSMTYQTPHAVRALNMVIPLTLIMGLGMIKLIENGGNLSKKYLIGNFRYAPLVALLTFVVTVLFTFEIFHYLESYYIHYPKRYPLAWEYGFNQMVSKLNQYESRYDNIVITDRYDQPYILVLFYKRYDPIKYQPQAVLSPRDKFNFGTVRSFDKYQFREIKPDEFKTTKNTLFIGTEKEIPKDAQIIDRITFPNGELAFVFAKT